MPTSETRTAEATQAYREAALAHVDAVRERLRNRAPGQRPLELLDSEAAFLFQLEVSRRMNADLEKDIDLLKDAARVSQRQRERDFAVIRGLRMRLEQIGIEAGDLCPVCRLGCRGEDRRIEIIRDGYSRQDNCENPDCFYGWEVKP